MGDAWALLVDLGLPDGAVRPAPTAAFDAAAAAAAVNEVARDTTLEEARVAPLLAWLRAWQHHWGDHFERTLGAEGAALVRRLQRRLDDRNRYLKLRRIAIANLAALL